MPGSENQIKLDETAGAHFTGRQELSRTPWICHYFELKLDYLSGKHASATNSPYPLGQAQFNILN